MIVSSKIVTQIANGLFTHQIDPESFVLKPLKAEDIVYVSINYRLNSFGFLNWIGDKETQQWAGY